LLFCAWDLSLTLTKVCGNIAARDSTLASVEKTRFSASHVQETFPQNGSGQGVDDD
jgi:hypothetical protein